MKETLREEVEELVMVSEKTKKKKKTILTEERKRANRWLTKVLLTRLPPFEDSILNFVFSLCVYFLLFLYI